jgi:hypothetical protein
MENYPALWQGHSNRSHINLSFAVGSFEAIEKIIHVLVANPISGRWRRRGW